MNREEKEKLCDELNTELGNKYFYPFSNKKFVFDRATYMDLVKMDLGDLKVIQHLTKSWENILDFDCKVERYEGKLPDDIIRENCFLLVLDKHFSMCCYIDIKKSDDTCIVFDIFPNFDNT